MTVTSLPSERNKQSKLKIETMDKILHSCLETGTITYRKAVAIFIVTTGWSTQAAEDAINAMIDVDWLHATNMEIRYHKTVNADCTLTTEGRMRAMAFEIALRNPQS